MSNIDGRIERKIIIGLVVSTEFTQNIRPYYQNKFLKSSVAKRLAKWCMDYFEHHSQSPGKNIELIFYSKVAEEKLPKEIAEEIENDILPDLSQEYEQAQFNFNYLFEEARKYFQIRHLEEHKTQIEGLISINDLEGAQKIANEFSPISKNLGNHLDLDSPQAIERISQAFKEKTNPLIKFPRAMGEFINDQLIRGGFVAFMASEKRGKSFMLLELANRAAKQGCKVAFFQAGDMTESQQLMRIAQYHSGRPVKESTIDQKYLPVRDCIHNQVDACDKQERECSHGIFSKKEVDAMQGGIRACVDKETLIKKLKEFPDYVACTNCKLYKEKQWGTPWIKPNHSHQLTVGAAQKAIQNFFIDKKRKFRLSSHANGTLSVREIKSLLDLWERQDDFIPDVILVDYADLLAPDTSEFRHGQNEIWKGLRSLSQSKSGQAVRLVITVTQADAKSYDQHRLKLSNFSEDKRKYAHVTAMYGLNQDPHGREKALGILRINELVVREGEFYTTREVYILQNLNIGKPLISSYW